MELLIENADNSNAVNDSRRCNKHTRKGRCTILIVDPSSLYCPDHSRAAARSRKSVDLSPLLTEGLTDFKSATTINDFLSRLLFLQAQGTIEPRRSSVMAYNCQLLLRTIPAIEHELNPSGESEQIIFDLPRPKRD